MSIREFTSPAFDADTETLLSAKAGTNMTTSEYCYGKYEETSRSEWRPYYQYKAHYTATDYMASCT